MKTKDIVNISLFTTLLAVCSWICIPTVVPFTMQTFAVFLAMLVLGGKKGTIVIGIYMILGMIGIPVFSRGTDWHNENNPDAKHAGLQGLGCFLVPLADI